MENSPLKGPAFALTLLACGGAPEKPLVPPHVPSTPAQESTQKIQESRNAYSEILGRLITWDHRKSPNDAKRKRVLAGIPGATFLHVNPIREEELYTLQKSASEPDQESAAPTLSSNNASAAPEDASGTEIEFSLNEVDSVSVFRREPNLDMVEVIEDCRLRTWEQSLRMTWDVEGSLWTTLAHVTQLVVAEGGYANRQDLLTWFNSAYQNEIEHLTFSRSDLRRIARDPNKVAQTVRDALGARGELAREQIRAVLDLPLEDILPLPLRLTNPKVENLTPLRPIKLIDPTHPNAIELIRKQALTPFPIQRVVFDEARCDPQQKPYYHGVSEIGHHACEVGVPTGLDVESMGLCVDQASGTRELVDCLLQLHLRGSPVFSNPDKSPRRNTLNPHGKRFEYPLKTSYEGQRDLLVDDLGLCMSHLQEIMQARIFLVALEQVLTEKVEERKGKITITDWLKRKEKLLKIIQGFGE